MQGRTALMEAADNYNSAFMVNLLVNGVSGGSGQDAAHIAAYVNVVDNQVSLCSLQQLVWHM